jgi:hypothetical protein
MISSYLTYQTRLAHIGDLRREAEDRRLASVARRDADRSRSTTRRDQRPRLSRHALQALSTLRPGRVARA